MFTLKYFMLKSKWTTIDRIIVIVDSVFIIFIIVMIFLI